MPSMPVDKRSTSDAFSVLDNQQLKRGDMVCADQVTHAGTMGTSKGQASRYMKWSLDRAFGFLMDGNCRPSMGTLCENLAATAAVP